MGRSWWVRRVACTSAAVAMVLAALASGTLRAADNLLANGGFEEADQKGQPAEWQLRAGFCQVVKRGELEGACCLRLSSDGKKDPYLWSTPIAVQPGEVVRVSAAVRVEQGNGDAQPILDAHFRAADDWRPLLVLRGSHSCYARDILGKGWTRLHSSGQAPPGTAQLCVGLSAWGLRTGSVFWDDVTVSIEKEQQFLPSAVYRFDFEDKASQTFPGFRKVTADDVYDPARGYGWLVGTGGKLESIERASVRVPVRKPDPLANDFCFADEVKFRVDLPAGRYKVGMVLGDIGRFWAEHGRDWRKGHSVKVGDSLPVYRAAFPDQKDYERNWFFKDYFSQYRKGEDVWDRYVEPLFPTYLFEARVEGGPDGKGPLEMEFGNAPLCGMVVFPEAAFGRVEGEMRALKAARKRMFPIKEIRYVRHPAAADLTDEERRRGYVAYARHYLDEIVPDTLPPRHEIGAPLRAFLSRNEYEPLTFGLYAVRELKGVQVTLSSLEGPGGARIQGDDVEIRLARLAPIAMGYEYRVMPHVLQPFSRVDVPADSSMWFWITVHAPRGLAPGVYRGRATIRPANADPLALDVAVRVLPITLGDGTRVALNNVLLSTEIPPKGRYEDVDRILKLYRRNNTTPAYLNTYSVGVPGTYNMERRQWENLSFDDTDAFMVHLKDLGFHLPFLILRWDSYPTRRYLIDKLGDSGKQDFATEYAKPKPFDHPYFDAQAQLIGELDRHMRERPDLYPADVYWAPFLFFPNVSDGAPFEDIKKAVDMFFQRTGARRSVFIQAIYLPVIQRVIDMQDQRQIVLGSRAITRDLVDLAHQRGMRAGYSNAGGLAVNPHWLKGEPNALGFYRLVHGLLAWANHVDMITDEGGCAEGGMPYNPFDYEPFFHDGFDLKTKMAPSPDGYLPLISYEASREGADDLRYAELMIDLAEKAEAGGNARAKAAAGRARAFQQDMERRIPPNILDPQRKDDLAWDGHRFDPCRWQIAETIMELQESLEGPHE